MDAVPTVSVVVPTYNRKKVLESCLDALCAQTYPRDKYEVIVVDDGSSDGTIGFLKEYSSKASFTLRFFVGEHRGASAARNLGIKNSSADIVCFTDDDCLPDKDWITQLVSGYSSDKVGCVGGRILSFEPRTLAEKYSDRRNLLVQENFLAAGAVITSNTSYRRKALLDVGGFDELFFAGEDPDLGIRVKLRGYEMVYEKKALVYHRHRASLLGLLSQIYFHAGAVMRLNKKYPRYFKSYLDLPVIPIRVLLSFRFFKSPYKDDLPYLFAEPILDVVVRSARFFGIVHELLLGDPYNGEIYTEKIPFLSERNFMSLPKAAVRRVSRLFK